MGSNKKIKQTEHFVAYFDILGYKEKFHNDIHIADNFLNDFNDAVKLVKSKMRIMLSKNTSKTESNHYMQDYNIEEIRSEKVKYKIFSDNFLLAIECSHDKDNFSRLLNIIFLVSQIQLILINKYGFFIRGGITKERLFINKDYVFGKALIDAYLLENKAFYPVVLIDKRVSDIIKYEQKQLYKQIKELRNVIKINSDDKNLTNKLEGVMILLKLVYFIISMLIRYKINKEIYINYLFMTLGDENRNANEISGSKKIDKDKFNDIKKHRAEVINKLNKYGNFNYCFTKEKYNDKKVETRRKVMDKYLWVLNYHNRVCEDNNFQEYKVDYKMDIDKTVHLPIIEVSSNEAI